MAETRTFPHHMIKEIFEQPQALHDTIAPRIAQRENSVQLNEVPISPEELRALRRINIVASGTSRHAGMAGHYMIQELLSIPVDVDYASEFEYRNPMIGRGELTIVITQSGETADTTAAAGSKSQRLANNRNFQRRRFNNRARGRWCYLHAAGPEISIASTKAFTAQMAALFLLALYLGEVRGTLTREQRAFYIGELMALPEKLQSVLACDSQCEQLAVKFHKVGRLPFYGQGRALSDCHGWSTQVERSVIRACEGYPTGETKHGPNALIDESFPWSSSRLVTAKMLGRSHVMRRAWEISRGSKKQGGRVIALATEGDQQVAKLADDTIYIPDAPELLSPILEIVPLQLFAYYMAVKRGLDVDRPRNLVKSVTLE